MRKKVTEPTRPATPPPTLPSARITTSATPFSSASSRHSNITAHSVDHSHPSAGIAIPANGNAKATIPATTTATGLVGGEGAQVFGALHRQAAEPNSFKYTRDFMVSLYSPELSMPNGCDLSDKVIISDLVLEPMANLPLTDMEKKVQWKLGLALLENGPFPFWQLNYCRYLPRILLIVRWIRSGGSQSIALTWSMLHARRRNQEIAEVCSFLSPSSTTHLKIKH
jgi:hypothetical protein